MLVLTGDVGINPLNLRRVPPDMTLHTQVLAEGWFVTPPSQLGLGYLAMR